jgi:uncharacterized protein (TIGR02001 family)
MNKKIPAWAVLAALSALPAMTHAQESPLSAYVTVASDYRFRGISQSRLKPALQAGVDYALPGGFYLGAWASTIRWIKDAGSINGVDTGNTWVELDLYGGYKGEITKDFGYDVGLLQYVYPGNELSRIAGAHSPNTLEAYGALTFGPATVKYSHSLTRLFGTGSSRGSGYLEAAASFDVGGGVTITPHVGHQRVRRNRDYSYTDYSLTAAKDWFGFTFSAAIVGADTRDIAGSPAYSSPRGRDLGRNGLVVAVKKTF